MLFALHRGARLVRVGAEHAAVAGFRPGDRPATRAAVHHHSGIRGHLHPLGEAARRAGDRRLGDRYKHVVHLF